MRAPLRTLVAGAFALSGLQTAVASELDLALVIAADISSSMTPAEQSLQRRGFVEAFRSELVHSAITKGVTGRIAVAYVEWSSADHQKLVLSWTLIDGPESANSFARQLEVEPIARGEKTSISGAIDFAASLFEMLALEPRRRVIDLSGDGPNNDGRPVTRARDDAVNKGITINGLPVMMVTEPWDWPAADVGKAEAKEQASPADLDLYFWDCVVGGTGAFVVPVRNASELISLVKTKILREVADLSYSQIVTKHVAAAAAPVCPTGSGAAGQSR